MRTRAIFFESSQKSRTVDFGTYAFILYYAKQVDNLLGKKLFDCTTSEYFYRANYDFPIGNLTDENEYVHFDLTDFQNVISFINASLIPALNCESTDPISKYGGRDRFFDLFYLNMDYLENISIERNEFYPNDVQTLIFYLDEIKSFLEGALTENQPFKVHVW
jgi:hypothetical protein